MSATFSVLYVTPAEDHCELIGCKNERDARYAGELLAKQGNTNVIIRCTTTAGNIVRTLWTEPLNPTDEDTPPDIANPWQDALNDLTTHTIPELLVAIQRATIHNQQPGTDWFERQLIEIDRDLCAIT